MASLLLMVVMVVCHAKDLGVVTKDGVHLCAYDAPDIVSVVALPRKVHETMTCREQAGEEDGWAGLPAARTAAHAACVAGGDPAACAAANAVVAQHVHSVVRDAIKVNIMEGHLMGARYMQQISPSLRTAGDVVTWQLLPESVVKEAGIKMATDFVDDTTPRPLPPNCRW